jgi:antiviral helicase SKI2
MLPKHINIILLSATVPNTFEFADWVGYVPDYVLGDIRRTKKKNIYVISTQKRPVPLEHHLFIASVVPAQVFKVVDAGKNFVQDGYKKAWDAVYVPKQEKAKPPPGKNTQKPGAVTKSSAKPSPTPFIGKQDRNMWTNLCGLLRKKSLLPVVVFTFSKKRCEENANTLNNLDLLSSNEKSEVHVFIERSLTRLKGTDKELPQILRMRDLLGRGIGVHHGGLLPIVKEVPIINNTINHL